MALESCSLLRKATSSVLKPRGFACCLLIGVETKEEEGNEEGNERE
jgi:hypothetical protein